MALSSSGKTRVLIVDDSTSMRMLIRSVLSAEPTLDVVGIAADGMEAVEKAQELKPDIVTMDVEMPRMNGIAALRQIMARRPATRVIMLSSLTLEGAKTTLDALDAGAFDYAAKSVGSDFKAEILAKIKAAAATLPTRSNTPPPQQRQPLQQGSAPATATKGKRIGVVAIGASTGGPVALQEVLKGIPAGFSHPIFIAIHMPKAFTGPFAERVNAKCAITVREAVDGEILKAGTALLAPGGMHATLVRQGGVLAVKLEPISAYPNNVFVPSVDLMMSSMAEASGGAMLGVILTGMGSDGCKGMKLVKQKGGTTLVQDETSSTIYGMPKACVDAGIADMVLPLDQIGPTIARIAG